MIAAKPIDLPAFYRVRFVWGRQCLVTLKGEIVRELPAEVSCSEIETLARAHDEMRHWTMVAKESKADTSDGGLAFTGYAQERLRVARGEFLKAMSRIEEGAA